MSRAMSASENTELAELQISNAITAMESEEAPSIVHAMLAQTRATLALAEQQRIANLIALAITPGSMMSAVTSEAVRSAEVREALGLS